MLLQDEYAKFHGKAETVDVERTKTISKQMLRALGHTFTDDEFEQVFSEFYVKLNQEFHKIISAPEKMLGHIPHKRI